MKVNIVPIVHPSWCFRGNWAHSRIQPTFLARAADVVAGVYNPIDTTTTPPNANLYPTIEDLHAFSHDSRVHDTFTVDLECAGDYLVCVGVLRTRDEAYVCVRFRDQGGPVHDPGNLEPRTQWLYDFLVDEDLGKIFHNGQAFDIPYLEEVGFEVNGFEDDTMLQAHLTYAELPKKLNFLALVYAGIPNWKTLVTPEEEEKEQ